jgi:putative membrane protein
MWRFIIQGLVSAAGLWLSAKIIPGVSFSSGGSLFAAVLVLALVNALVKPVMVILTLPLTIVTLGLFLLVVNAAMIGLTAWFLGGFEVQGLGAGIGAAIITGLVSWLAGGFINKDKG